MKERSVFFLLMLLYLASACQSESSTSQADSTSSSQEEPQILSVKLSPEAFLKKLNEKGRDQLIDVRTPEEVAKGQIPKARNMDVRSADFQSQLAQLDKSQPVFVYCARGSRSGKAANILEEMGFQEIYDLTGGFTQWAQKGMETDK